MCLNNRSWLPRYGDLRALIMHESHKQIFCSPGVRDKDVPGQRSNYTGGLHMKADNAPPKLSKVLTCLRVKPNTKPSAYLVQTSNSSMEVRKISLWTLSPNSQELKVETTPYGKAMGTRMDMISAYHPETDDKATGPFQTLEVNVTCLCDILDGWERILDRLIKFSYNKKQAMLVT
ncbi:hypothetical protein Tco_1243780 [Tanacetum coccineum]